MLFGRKTAPSSAGADIGCVWCKRPRVEVLALVSDDAVAICNDCLALAVATMDHDDEGLRPRFAIAQQVLEQSLANLGKPASESDVERLLTAALALNGEDPIGRRRLARLALGAGATPTGRALLGSIPAERRTPEDVMLLAWTHLTDGDYDECLQVLDGPAEGAPVPATAGLLRVYRVAARLGPERSLSHGDLDEMIASLGEARELCGEAHRLALDGNLAECLLRRGDVASAHAILRRLIAAHPDDAELQVLLGDALALRGETAPAREAWRRVTQHPQVTPRTAARARERLARGGTPYR